jgi:hypothetical protein
VQAGPQSISQARQRGNKNYKTPWRFACPSSQLYLLCGRQGGPASASSQPAAAARRRRGTTVQSQGDSVPPASFSQLEFLGARDLLGRPRPLRGWAGDWSEARRWWWWPGWVGHGDTDSRQFWQASSRGAGAGAAVGVAHSEAIGPLALAQEPRGACALLLRLLCACTHHTMTQTPAALVAQLADS